MKNFNDIPKLPGFYKIKSKRSKKIYFGETLNLNKRIKKHFYELTNKTHKNFRLQKEFNKLGIDNFIISLYVRKSYTKKELLKIEERFILLFKLKENHFNIISSYSDYLSNINKDKNHIKLNREREIL
jgi:group I intron endonuclease